MLRATKFVDSTTRFTSLRIMMVCALVAHTLIGACAREPETGWLFGDVPDQLREHECPIRWLVSPGSQGDFIEINPASQDGLFVNEIHIDGFDCFIGPIVITDDDAILVWGIPTAPTGSSPGGIYQVDLEQKQAVLVAAQGPNVHGRIAAGNVLGLYAFSRDGKKRIAVISEHRFTVLDGGSYDILESSELPWAAWKWSHMGGGKFVGSEWEGYGGFRHRNRINFLRSMFIDASDPDNISITDIDAPWAVATSSDLRNEIVAHDGESWYVWSYTDGAPPLFKKDRFLYKAPAWLNLKIFRSCTGLTVTVQSHEIPYGTLWVVGQSQLSLPGFNVYGVAELCNCTDTE